MFCTTFPTYVGITDIEALQGNSMGALIYYIEDATV